MNHTNNNQSDLKGSDLNKIKMKLKYIGGSSSCFTNGKSYDVYDSEQEDYYIATDNQGDDVYRAKVVFE